MAENKILQFAEAGQEGKDIQTFEQYNEEEVRKRGNQYGLARREVVNSSLMQSSSVATAIGQLLANKGYEVAYKPNPNLIASQLQEIIGEAPPPQPADKSEVFTPLNGNAYIVTTLGDGSRLLNLMAEINQDAGVNQTITLPLPLTKGRYAISEGATADSLVVSLQPVVNTFLDLIGVNITLAQGTGNKIWIHIMGIIDPKDLPLHPKLTSSNLEGRSLTIVFDKGDPDTSVITDLMVKKSPTEEWSLLQAGISSPFMRDFTLTQLPPSSVWELQLSNTKGGFSSFSEVFQIASLVVTNVAFTNALGEVKISVPNTDFIPPSFNIDFLTSIDQAGAYEVRDTVASNLFLLEGVERTYSSKVQDLFGIPALPFMRVKSR